MGFFSDFFKIGFGFGLTVFRCWLGVWLGVWLGDGSLVRVAFAGC